LVARSLTVTIQIIHEQDSLVTGIDLNPQVEVHVYWGPDVDVPSGKSNHGAAKDKKAKGDGE
jgi:hypothetical protein